MVAQAPDDRLPRRRVAARPAGTPRPSEALRRAQRAGGGRYVERARRSRARVQRGGRTWLTRDAPGGQPTDRDTGSRSRRSRSLAPRLPGPPPTSNVAHTTAPHRSVALHDWHRRSSNPGGRVALAPDRRVCDGWPRLAIGGADGSTLNRVPPPAMCASAELRSALGPPLRRGRLERANRGGVSRTRREPLSRRGTPPGSDFQTTGYPRESWSTRHYRTAPPCPFHL